MQNINKDYETLISESFYYPIPEQSSTANNSNDVQANRAYTRARDEITLSDKWGTIFAVYGIFLMGLGVFSILFRYFLYQFELTKNEVWILGFLSNVFMIFDGILSLSTYFVKRWPKLRLFLIGWFMLSTTATWIYSSILSLLLGVLIWGNIFPGGATGMSIFEITLSMILAFLFSFFSCALGLNHCWVVSRIQAYQI